jgi:hypothetical protein
MKKSLGMKPRDPKATTDYMTDFLILSVMADLTSLILTYYRVLYSTEDSVHIRGLVLKRS